MSVEESIEAIYRLSHGVEDLEEAINPRQLQNNGGLGTNSGELQIAIAVRDLFHTMEKHVHACAVDLVNSRKIKYDTRPVLLEDRSDFPQQALDVSQLYLLRQLFHDYWFLR